MATFERIYIENVSLNTVISFFETFFKLNRIEVLSNVEIIRYHEIGNRTFIFRKLNRSWVEFELDIEEVFELDEVLRQLSATFSTRVFFFFKQTTSGDVRLALFSNGVMLRSFYQVYIDHLETMRVLQNFGPKLIFEEKFDYPSKYREPSIEIIGRINSFFYGTKQSRTCYLQEL